MNELWFISLERKYWLSGWHSNNAHTSHCCDMSYVPGIDMTLWDGNMVNKSGRWIPQGMPVSSQTNKNIGSN